MAAGAAGDSAIGGASGAEAYAEATDDGGSFTLVTYNILARSLGSNTVPWVMGVSPEWEARVDAHLAAAHGATARNWAGVRQALAAEYGGKFHKNDATQDDPLKYHSMRALWATERLASADDVPADINRARFHAPWQVAYTGRSGEEVVATTMAGMLRTIIGDEGLAEELFEHIMDAERRVFSWRLRGPRIYQRIMRHHDGGLGWPSVIVLQEYDAHTVTAPYREGGGEETFCEAMRAAAYHGTLFCGASGASGSALFWRADDWALAETRATDAPDKAAATVVAGDAAASTLWPDASHGDCLMNVAMHDHWHRLDDADAGLTAMRESDWQSFGMARLRHRRSGRIVWFIAAHLMTTSRDGPSKTRYPGEVRARELATIRDRVQRSVLPGEAVCLAGDFNTRPYERHVFTGRVPAAGGAAGVSGDEVVVETGFLLPHEGGPAAFDWTRSDGSAGGAVLRDLYEDVHGWPSTKEGSPADASGLTYATSVNGVRRDWIDYVWATPESLAAEARAPTLPGTEPLPTETEPSDHIPLVTRITLVGHAAASSP